MRLKVLFDNDALPGYKASYGFACLIETGKNVILFDTGGDPSILAHNMKTADVAKEDISIIVISHDHWDHTGGLPSVMHERLKAFIPASASMELEVECGRGEEVVRVDGRMEICPGVVTTGELDGHPVKEQALLLKTDDGIIVLTGCAHPGLETILEVARKEGKVKGIMGGFHDHVDMKHLDGLEILGPCHCTTKREAIVKRFEDRIVELAAGKKLDI